MPTAERVARNKTIWLSKPPSFDRMKATTTMKDAKSSSPVDVSSESFTTVPPSSLSDHCSTTASESCEEEQRLFPWSLEEMKASLGEGPMRFAPNLAQHLAAASTTTTTTAITPSTSDTESSCSSESATNSSSSSSGSGTSSSQQSPREKKGCENLKTQWQASNPDVPFSYDMYLRLQNEKLAVAHSRGTAVAAGAAVPDFYTPFGLSIEELEPQLLTEVGSC